MEELRFHFQGYQFAIFSMWVLLTAVMFFKGYLKLYFSKLSLFAVLSMVGYISLISFGILGAGFSKGLIFPNFDAYVEPFLLFFFGIPIMMIAISIFYAMEVERTRKIRPVMLSHFVTSIYILWSALMVHVNVISGI